MLAKYKTNPVNSWFSAKQTLLIVSNKGGTKFPESLFWTQPVVGNLNLSSQVKPEKDGAAYIFWAGES